MRSTLAKPVVRKVMLIALVLIVIGLGIGVYTQVTAFSYGDLVTSLRASGATVREGGSASGILFHGSGHDLEVNGVGVAAFEYGTTIAAFMDANRVSSDGSTANGGFGPFGGQAVTVDWIAPPHHFRQGRVIVSYIGSDTSILHLLTDTLGAQFAGGAVS